MEISLIITTYNWPQALALVLDSALLQKCLPCEVLVADDGSTEETRQLVEEVASRSSVVVKHVWQEDKGFRAARSRNLAIAQASGDYIVLVDGDMLLAPTFLGDHAFLARSGQFIQGSRVLLSAQLSQQALTDHLPKGLFWQAGVGNRKNLVHSLFLARLFSRQKTGYGGIRTCNFSFWRDDAMKVNGFNEDFIGWGREDSEFAVRLLNSGLRRLNARFSAVALHIHHPFQDRQMLPANDALLAEAINSRKVWCDNGLQNHLAVTTSSLS